MSYKIKLKPYNKKSEQSYALGAFPTIELLKAQPQHVHKVLVHSSFHMANQLDSIQKLCSRFRVNYEINDRAVEKLRKKENCLVIGVFHKYISTLEPDVNHVMLVQPSDMGNMGTIMRACIGFGIENLAIIDPSVDVFHPKIIRASMGSIFHLHFSHYESFEQYQGHYPGHSLYPFMLNGETELKDLRRPKSEVFTAIFGNESSGLDESYLNVGKSIHISHSDKIDSLNLSLAVGIGLYELARGCTME